MGKLICGVTLPLMVFVAACSKDPVDIGDDKTGEFLADYAGSWDGYAEAYQFDSEIDSRSDRIRLVLDAAGKGRIEFGDAPRLPPPTDPDVGYPPSPIYLDPVTGGFLYTVQNSNVEARRIRFGVDVSELFDDWCVMQTPFFDQASSTPESPKYYCAPNQGYSKSPDAPDDCLTTDAAGMPLVVNCRKLALCQGGVCKCTADGCSAPPIPPNLPAEQFGVQIDAAFDAETTRLLGTLVMQGKPRITVHLARQ